MNKWRGNGVIQLEKAEHEEFSSFFSVYRDNVRFRRDWNIPLTSVPRGSANYWIIQGDCRIGGVQLNPNKIGHLFMIPPNKFTSEILSSLLLQLQSISYFARPIEALGVLEDQLPIYEAAGFRQILPRRCMMRPTELLTVAFPYQFKGLRPVSSQLDELSHVLFQSFTQGTGDIMTDSEEDFQEFVDDFFKKSAKDVSLLEASTMLIDKQTGQVAGACFVGRNEGWPFISNVAVLPKFRGNGLATQMIRHSLSSLFLREPILQLFVTVGNKAEIVYEKLGFWSAPVVTRMELANWKKTTKELS